MSVPEQIDPGQVFIIRSDPDPVRKIRSDRIPSDLKKSTFLFSNLLTKVINNPQGLFSDFKKAPEFKEKIYETSRVQNIQDRK